MASMHGQNPLSLVSAFRDYTVLYGDPADGYEVQLSSHRSDRQAVLTYHTGEASWRSFLLELDPEIDERGLDPRDITSRTPMANPKGQPMNVDHVFEEVFGLA